MFIFGYRAGKICMRRMYSLAQISQTRSMRKQRRTLLLSRPRRARRINLLDDHFGKSKDAEEQPRDTFKLARRRRKNYNNIYTRNIYISSSTNPHQHRLVFHSIIQQPLLPLEKLAWTAVSKTWVIFERAFALHSTYWNACISVANFCPCLC